MSRYSKKLEALARMDVATASRGLKRLHANQVHKVRFGNLRPYYVRATKSLRIFFALAESTWMILGFASKTDAVLYGSERG